MNRFQKRFKIIKNIALVAQRIEQVPSKHKVVGSNPAGGACMTKMDVGVKIFGEIACVEGPLPTGM